MIQVQLASTLFYWLFAFIISFFVTTSGEKEFPLIDVTTVIPDIIVEMRYLTNHNFMGRRVNGYQNNRCLLSKEAANALIGVQTAVKKEGMSLKVYDCYRPTRAVADFMNWSKNPTDNATKTEFYPTIDKSKVFELGYVAEKSGHSRGSTVDLTLVKLPAAPQEQYDPNDLKSCFAQPKNNRFGDNTMDFGTGFDCFSEYSHTANYDLWGKDSEIQKNREYLVAVMKANKFTNYEGEWWHYTLDNEPFPGTYFDEIV